MQIRNRAKPFGMTRLSNGLDSAGWLWTHQYRARVPPWGVNRADALYVSPSNFSAKKSALVHPHRTTSRHNSIRVDIGEYR